MILLVENPTHPGIALISAAYKRAFEHLGIDFHFLSFRKEPQASIDEINLIVQNKINSCSYNPVIIIQPTFLTGQTYVQAVVTQKKKGIRFYCINTEDPYSVSGILQINNLFDIKFTNEKLVADKYSNLGFQYLPVAFDSLMPYKHSEKKDFDLCAILTYYQDRYEYLKQIPEGLKTFVTGSISPLIRDAVSPVLDLKLFSTAPSMIHRHKEYEYYSRSKFVLNPHRRPEIVGRQYLNIIEGQPCVPMFKDAISPNPRFFDAIGCGAIPLCDESRTECFEILFKNALSLEESNSFKLSFLNKLNNPSNINNPVIMSLFESFRINETYINRAQQVLNAIELSKSAETI